MAIGSRPRRVDSACRCRRSRGSAYRLADGRPGSAAVRPDVPSSASQRKRWHGGATRRNRGANRQAPRQLRLAGQLLEGIAVASNVPTRPGNSDSCGAGLSFLTLASSRGLKTTSSPPFAEQDIYGGHPCEEAWKVSAPTSTGYQGGYPPSNPARTAATGRRKHQETRP